MKEFGLVAGHDDRRISIGYPIAPADVGKDGALEGPNLALYSDCVERWPGIAFQASGGVRDVKDLEALAKVGVTRAVAGKALLEGRLSSEEIRSFLPNE
jgi:phosphoribosylformimino-5-aminoimidazole carboxamide ribotide isomerase